MTCEFDISGSLEDYLEAIFFLEQTNDVVRVTDIASKLNISKPSVNKAIKILKQKGLVEHEDYGTLKLTSKGYVPAKNIAERHKVIKKFLHELLGVDISTAESEACKLEHSMSSSTVSKLRDYLEKVGF